MKIAPYVDKLNASPKYSTFAKEHRDAFMVAGFFVLDYEGGKNLHQIDYYIPSEKKMAAFTLDEGVTLQVLALMNKKIPEKLDIKTKVDLEAIKGILEDEMHNRSITEEIKKIIAVVQTLEGKKVWTLNCVLSGMGILRASVDDDSQTVLKMEKSSIFDYIKKIPQAQLAAMQQQKPASKEAIADEMKKLDTLEKQIEAEKEELQKQMQKEPAIKAGNNAKIEKPSRDKQTTKAKRLKA